MEFIIRANGVVIIKFDQVNSITEAYNIADEINDKGDLKDFSNLELEFDGMSLPYAFN